MYLVSVLFLGLFFQLQWPAVDMEHGIRENKMLYKFAYLPAGLFNRAQVSLVQMNTQEFYKQYKMTNTYLICSNM